MSIVPDLYLTPRPKHWDLNILPPALRLYSARYGPDPRFAFVEGAPNKPFRVNTLWLLLCELLTTGENPELARALDAAIDEVCDLIVRGEIQTGHPVVSLVGNPAMLRLVT